MLKWNKIMKLYAKEKSYELYNGDMLDMKEVIKDNSIDSIVCDPPYGLTSITKRFGKEGSAAAQYGKDGSFSRLSKGFMNESWDGSGIEYNVEAWRKCYDVLKPGGYLLVFGGSRTFHRIACAIEDAGFEIRDTIMWLYGSGFPKSMNLGLKMDKKFGFPDRGHRIAMASRFHPDGTFEPNGEELSSYEAKTELGKLWQGWGTSLKPAYEPIIVARKPFKGSLVDNVIENGVGGINIDECRVGEEHFEQQQQHVQTKGIYGDKVLLAKSYDGRFPANVILTYDENDFNEVCGGMPDENGLSASRYFYCAKASRKDRDEGLELEFSEVKTTDGCIRANKETARKFGANSSLRRNIHPTVKPTELMQYLVRLVSPSGATILDPFMGSGSTGKAVMFENRERNVDYKFIGIELTEKYLPIAKARIDYALNQYEYDAKEKEIKTGQMSLFDYKEE